MFTIKVPGAAGVAGDTSCWAVRADVCIHKTVVLL